MSDLFLFLLMYQTSLSPRSPVWAVSKLLQFSKTPTWSDPQVMQPRPDAAGLTSIKNKNRGPVRPKLLNVFTMNSLCRVLLVGPAHWELRLTRGKSRSLWQSEARATHLFTRSSAGADSFFLFPLFKTELFDYSLLYSIFSIFNENNICSKLIKNLPHSLSVNGLKSQWRSHERLYHHCTVTSGIHYTLRITTATTLQCVRNYVYMLFMNDDAVTYIKMRNCIL